MSVKNTVDFMKVKRKMMAAINLYGNTEAKRMETYAKNTRPWTDITSNAKNSIQGTFDWEGDKAVIYLSGNMDYFVYLELAMSKKYAVLVPTINSMSPQILSGYKKLVG